MANQYSCLEKPMNSMKRQNDRILKEELPRSFCTKDMLLLLLSRFSKLNISL